jgi:hypothetical protein
MMKRYSYYPANETIPVIFKKANLSGVYLHKSKQSGIKKYPESFWNAYIPKLNRWRLVNLSHNKKPTAKKLFHFSFSLHVGILHLFSSIIDTLLLNKKIKS